MGDAQRAVAERRDPAAQFVFRAALVDLAGVAEELASNLPALDLNPRER